MLSRKLSRGRKASVVLVTMLASCIAIVSMASAQSQRQGYLGVTTQTLTDELREGLDFNYDGDGALVSDVSDGSPADRAGIRPGDIIVSINSEDIAGSSELRRVVRGFDEGENVSVKVIRNGSSRTLDVRLGGVRASEGGQDSGDRDNDDWGWRSGDDFPVPPTPPAAPRAPASPSPSFGPRTYWFHGDEGDDHMKKSLEGLKGLEKLKELEGLEGMDGDRLMVRTLGRGRLGVSIEDLDDDTADQLDIPSGRGALVRSVVDDSPARRAGIKAGDVIIRVNDQRIDDSSDLMNTIRGLDEGPARITVVRRGGTQTLTANIAPRADLPNVMRFQTPRGTWERRLADRERSRADRMRMYSDRDRSSNGDLQREIESLKQEVERLRRELDRRDDR